MPRTKILSRSQGQSEQIPFRENAQGARKKTRPPASVRSVEREKRDKMKVLADSSVNETRAMSLRRQGSLAESSESDEVKEVCILDDSDASPTTSTQPMLSVRSAQGRSSQVPDTSLSGLNSGQALPSALTMLAEIIWQAIDKQNWDRLGHLVDGMHEQKLRFDAPELQQSAAARQIIQSAPLALLTQIDDSSDADAERKWLLALDLVDLGCDKKATNLDGHSVVDLLRQKADKALIDEVVTDRPDLKPLLVPGASSRKRPASDRH